MTPSLACLCVGLLALGLGAVHALGDEPPRTRPAPGGSPTPLKNVEFLEQYAATRGFTHGTPKNIAITPDGSAVFFLRSGPRSFVQDLFVVDTASGQESTFLTADKVLAGKEEKLTAEELARRERMRLASRGIASYAISKDGKRVLVPLSGRLFVIARDGTKAGKTIELKSGAGYPIDPQFSPDGAKVACVRDGDLYVIDIAGGAETRLTTKTAETITNGVAEFVAQEEMDRFHGFWWSPDSKQIAYEQADTAGMEIFHIADSMNPDKEAQAWPYPRPGKKNAVVRLFVSPTSTSEAKTEVRWDRAKYEYLAKVSWSKDCPLSLFVMNREQTSQALLHAEPTNGTTSEFAAEDDPSWLNLMPGSPQWVPGTTTFVRVSDRSGEFRLESCGFHPGDDSFAHARLSPSSFGMLPTGFGLQQIIGIDEQSRAVLVLASSDPTQTHVFAVPLTAAPENTRQLTKDRGVHGLTTSDQSDLVVESAALLDGQLSWQMRRLNSRGSTFDLKLTRETPPWTPRLELEVVGEKKFNAALIRPRDFDPAKKYPVIVNVYGGPHHQMVRASPQLYYLQQWIADQGFIIAMIDGRGTPNRGRDWERAIKNDLIGPALEDQVAGLKALGEKHKEMDLSRVGIYGWSFGGYFSAIATMQRPDVYMAGCAGAPVCDWLDYDTCYTERYLGVPKNADDPIYKKSSVLTYCKDLQRPLLIIHGTSDDNVYFMHSLKMTQALFREGKPFEFLPLAGFTHMVPDPVVTTRLYSRIATFFKEKLGEPR